MAKDLENKIDEEVEKVEEFDAEEVEDIDYDDDEDFEEAGFKVHKFSLFDSPLEIITILFVIAYLVFGIWKFFDIYPQGAQLKFVIEFVFDLIAKVIPAVILIIAIEIHEKLEMQEYNLRLNSEYMARYQQDLLERLNMMDDKKTK